MFLVHRLWFGSKGKGMLQLRTEKKILQKWNLVSRKIDLVYWEGSVGLMGLISQKVYDGGCHVLGVIPRALVPIEISGETVGDAKIVSDMHERKAEMSRQADAFIDFPGWFTKCRWLL